jgi:hypothetical protein
MTATERRLRVSIVVKSAIAPAWIGALVERLRGSPHFELRVFLDVATRGDAWPWAYRMYERADARIFRHPRDALAAVRLSGPRPRDLTLLDECDVVLHFGSENPDALVGAARCGVWILSHVDEQERCRVPPLFWEMHRHDLYRTTLEAHFADGDRRVLYNSHGRPNTTSLHRSRNHAYWKAQGAIARALDALHERGRSYLESRPRPDELQARNEQGPPSAATIARHVAAVSFGVVIRRLRKLAFREEWFVATRRTSGGSLIDENSAVVDEFRALATGASEHFADPFVFDHGGETYLFFERYDERLRRATIGYARLDATTNTIGRPMSALARKYHVSYPFVFRHGGDVFMIPESFENETVDLYRAVDFPSRWIHEDCLLNRVCAVDSTLFEEGSRLWLFVGLAEPGASVNDELHLYSSTTLRGPWVPHPENPVVSDVRSARPAGRIFRHRGQLIRPSQDCSQGYGTAVVFNRIDVLTANHYAESAIRRIEPTWARGLLGTHTYNSTGRVEVVDGRRFTLRLPLHRPKTRARRGE